MDLNILSFSFNLGVFSREEVSKLALAKNGLGVYTALHEIAQLNIAKQLSISGYTTELEYKINKYEVDVESRGMIWEVKPITQRFTQSAQKQLTKYIKMDPSLEEGTLLEKPIEGIPVMKDIYMKIEFGDPGTAYYSLYRMKDGEAVLVTNKEFKKEYLEYKYVEPMKRVTNELGNIISDFAGKNYPFYWKLGIPAY